MPGKVLRCSMYSGPNDRNPITFITRAKDLRTSPEVAADEMERTAPGVFVVTDVFEVDDDTYRDPVKAVLAGTRRLQDSARLKVEMDMALCFYWNTAALDRVNPYGTLTATRPAPLTVDQLKVVLRQIARHPKWSGHRVVQIAIDEKLVVLHSDSSLT